MTYTWGGNQCMRHAKSFKDEAHPCYYCGIPLVIHGDKHAEVCQKCGFMICPSCLKCVCNVDDVTFGALVYLRNTYCCQEKGFREGINRGGMLEQGALAFVPHFADALDYCRKKEGVI